MSTTIEIPPDCLLALTMSVKNITSNRRLIRFIQRFFLNVHAIKNICMSAEEKDRLFIRGDLYDDQWLLYTFEVTCIVVIEGGKLKGKNFTVAILPKIRGSRIPFEHLAKRLEQLSHDYLNRFLIGSMVIHQLQPIFSVEFQNDLLRKQKTFDSAVLQAIHSPVSAKRSLEVSLEIALARLKGFSAYIDSMATSHPSIHLKNIRVMFQESQIAFDLEAFWGDVSLPVQGTIHMSMGDGTLFAIIDLTGFVQGRLKIDVQAFIENGALVIRVLNACLVGKNFTVILTKMIEEALEGFLRNSLLRETTFRQITFDPSFFSLTFRMREKVITVTLVV